MYSLPLIAFSKTRVKKRQKEEEPDDCVEKMHQFTYAIEQKLTANYQHKCVFTDTLHMKVY